MSSETPKIRKTPPNLRGKEHTKKAPKSSSAPRIIIGTAVLAIATTAAFKLKDCLSHNPETSAVSENKPPQPSRNLKEIDNRADFNPNNPIERIFAAATANKESKKYHYNFSGLQFVSDSVQEPQIQHAFTEAQQKIGGPYWKPKNKITIELSKITGAKFGLPQGVEISVTHPKSYDVLTTQEAMAHEMCHVLMGPDSVNIPGVFVEFIAHSSSPNDTLTYRSEDNNHSAISMIDPSWASPSDTRNHFDDVRKATLVSISKNLSDDTRKKMVGDALEKGSMSFEELPAFLANYGIHHKIFEKGTLGDHHAAFLGESTQSGKIILLVSYKTIPYQQGFNEIPQTASLTVILRDKSNQPLGAKINIQMKGLELAYLSKLARSADESIKPEDISSIEILEWNQKINLEKK